MIPLMLGGQAVGSWLSNNLVQGGVNGWINNALNPKMALSPTLTNDGSLSAFSAERYKFFTQVIAPSDKDIRALDDFFESFGYRVDLFQVPNMALRSNFTYIKTRDAVVYSNIKPAADQLAAMLNQGYKFWKTEIGK